MHPAEITAALAVAGVRQKALAAQLGVAAGTVSAVVHGRSRSAQIEQRIAEITGLPLAELWPTWHGGEVELVLSAQERALVLAFRDLSAHQRAEEVLRMKYLPRNLSPAAAGTIIHQGAHGRAAAGNYVEHAVHDRPAPKRKK